MNHQDTIERIIKANPVPDEDLLHSDPAEAADLYGSILARRDNAEGTRVRGRAPDRARPAPWYRRPPVVVAAAAVVVAAIMVPVAVLNRGDDSRDPNVPVVASTAANGEPTAQPTTAELLQVEDLPAGFDWAERPLSRDWIAESEEYVGIRLALCDDLFDFAFDPPVGELDGGVFASFHAPAGEVGTVTVDQMVYADTPAAVKSAYDDTRRRIMNCVDDPTQWRQSGVEGDRIHGSMLSISEVGDERFAISYTTMTDSLRGYHRLAVIRDGDRLTIIEISEGLIPRTAPAQLGRAEFEAVLWQAVGYRGAGEDCTGFCPSEALLGADDLPDAFSWRLEPNPEWYTDPSPPTSIQPALCPELFDLGARPPLGDLQNHVYTSLAADPRPNQGSLHIRQVAYSDSEAAISAAFDSIGRQLTSCVNNPSRWDEWVTPEGRADGWALRAGQIPITPVGDDLIAIQVALYNTNDQSVWFDDRFALVRQGGWLAIVVLSEGMPRGQILTDDEFAAILQSAVARLESES